MKDFKGKVAVITGGASGIGKAVAERCVKEGMAVVIADIEQGTLDSATNELRQQGGDAIGVKTDVSQSDDIEALAQKTVEEFGTVDFLMNNAGVAGSSVIMGTKADWEWTMGVNLWGVIHGVRVFTPIMIQQGTPAHIVNTASVAGITSAQLGSYTVTKHAVVALSEQLYMELQHANAKVNVSVLCPGFVNTNIIDSERNRPSELQNEQQAEPTPEQQMREQQLRAMIEAGMPPSQVANFVFDAVENDKLYIQTHPDDFREMIKMRVDHIINGTNPEVGML